ncbi:MAG: BatA domain-containing protein [Pirellulaceae bacterium]
MSFLHLSLIAGLAVVTVPIMLHLFGQKQPQMIDFPALRFVRQTRQEQSSSWQLRHFLLLLLRILLLAALALALARPRVHSAMLGSVLGVTGVAVLAALASLIAAVAFVSKRPFSVWLTCTVIAIALWASAGLWGARSLSSGPSVPTSDSSAPIAAALIIDNSPTMGYQAGNQTRLEAAQEMSTWILDQLPLDSRVGVLSGAPVGALALDPNTAKSQVKIVEVRALHVDLLSQIRTALDLVLANELERKEIYVVTDLMSPSWNSVQTDLIALLNQHKDEVLVQIIDIGETSFNNWQLSDVEADFYTLPAGGDVTFTVNVYRVDSVASDKVSTVSVELFQEAIDPNLPVVSNGELMTPDSRVVDRVNVDIKSGGSATVELKATALAAGTHHFTIRLDQPDPLMIDNQRYVTVVAREQQPTLIVANDTELARQLKLLVDIRGARAEDGSSLVEDIRYAQLSRVELEKYDVVCLLDPPPMSESMATRIKEHVMGGGGLLTILGPNLGSPDQIRGNALESLLPGTPSQVLARQPSDRSAFLVPVALTHPVFHELAAMDDQVPWYLFPIFRSITFGSLVDGAVVLANLSTEDNPPVLVSHKIGRGQVLTLTTPLPETEVRGAPLWNELWIGTDPWPAYALLLGSFQTLSGADQANLNFAAGSPVNLENDTFRWPSRYQLFAPNAQTRRADTTDGQLALGKFERAGIYRLRGMRNQPVTRGFSINAAADDTQLMRLDSVQLDERLGEHNYRVARNRNEVESSVGQARFGRELYPLLMVFVAALFLAEQAMSNRFYKLQLSRGARVRASAKVSSSRVVTSREGV